MIANHVPSRITSTAADVAARASVILVFGTSMDPEQSTMMISAVPPLAPGSGEVASPVAPTVTVTTALTSRAPGDRYGFWSTSTVNPGRLVIALLLTESCPGCWPDAVSHVHQFDAEGGVSRPAC